MTDLAAMGGSGRTHRKRSARKRCSPASRRSGLRSYAREVAAYTRGRGHLSCTLRGYEPCADAERRHRRHRLRSRARRGKPPPAPVFCEHGAGVYVPWNEGQGPRTSPASYRSTPPKAAEPMPTRSRALSSGSAAEDKELLAIFESTYGKVERRAFEPKRAPARTALDETRYNIKNRRPVPSICSWTATTSSSRGTRSKSCRAGRLPPRARRSRILANYRGWRRCKRSFWFDAYKVKGQSRLDGKEKRHLHRSTPRRRRDLRDSYIERATYELRRGAACAWRRPTAPSRSSSSATGCCASPPARSMPRESAEDRSAPCRNASDEPSAQRTHHQKQRKAQN